MNLLVLDATSKSIRGVLASGSASANPQFTVHYMDVTASTAVEGNIDGNFNGVTNVEVCAAPGASTRRIIREIVVYNADTASITFSIMLRVTATDYYIAKVTLGVNGTWTFDGTMPTYDIAANIHGSPNKTTPVDADEAGIWDSVTGLLNKVTWANIKATLKTYLDTLYLALVAPGTAGNVLTSTGSAWASAAAASGGGDWTDATGTWSYSSADAPTFVASVNNDQTAIIYPGQRLSLTQTTEKFFIVTAVGAYSGGNTLITMYGGTDYTLAAAAITTPKWSNVKVPSRFPMTPAKWTVEFTDVTLRTQDTPTASTWYNLGTASISIPIGVWKASYRVILQAVINGDAVNVDTTLSTANNSESDKKWTSRVQNNGATATTFLALGSMFNDNLITVAAKTSYYLNTMSLYSATSIANKNADGTLVIKAMCAYL